MHNDINYPGGIIMKRILGLIVLILLMYVIYYDLSKGTLSLVQASNEENEKSVVIEVEQELAYFEKRADSGDTLLSVVEENLKSSIPVSIEMIIEDFKALNDGLTPQEIQYGKIYKFPDYRSNLEE